MMLPSCAAVAPSFQSRYARFEVDADPCPQALARIVGLFAGQALLPSDIRAWHTDRGMCISIEVDLPPVQAARLSEKLRTLVSVRDVIFSSPGEEIYGG